MKYSKELHDKLRNRTGLHIFNHQIGLDSEDIDALLDEIDRLIEDNTKFQEMATTKLAHANGKIEELTATTHSQTLRNAELSRFVWWVYQVYARNVLDLVQSVPVMCPCDTEEDVPFIELAARIKEYTEHIYDGTYLDTAMSTEQSNSDVSMTQDVLTDIKTPQSIENTNPDYYKQDAVSWISIANGRLPEKFQECIVLDKNKRVHNWIHDDALLPLFAEYTHWMPLPEPPEEERC